MKKIIVLLLALCMACLLYTSHIYVTTSYMSLGKTMQFENPMGVFDYFCGKYLGKLVAALTVVYALFAPSVMISGFGATINQLTGFPMVAGSIIMGTIVTLTVMLGLHRIADIIGTIGPVSYTHLDVYKRQDCKPAQLICRKE